MTPQHKQRLKRKIITLLNKTNDKELSDFTSFKDIRTELNLTLTRLNSIPTHGKD